MKRCPQCEFIYEDDQNLCDMDGVLLVFDGRSLPNLHALAPVEAPAVTKTYWRQRTFPAMAALILATVFSLVYFISTQSTRSGITPPPVNTPISVSEAPLNPPPSVDSTATATHTNPTPPSPAPEANAGTTTTKEEKRSDQPKAPAPAAKKASSKETTTQRQPEEPKKEDSKVGSILKKTGRLLKKPFKL